MAKAEIVITFPNTHNAIMAEKCLLAQSLPVMVMPLPEAIQAGCGLCLRTQPAQLTAALSELAAQNVAYAGLYKRQVINGRSAYSPYRQEGANEP